MAKAVGDYWESKGILGRLADTDVKSDVPLYIESFGTLETLEKIMSIPVNVMTPLTTFENIKTMYDELSAKGVSNINFRLTGFANGGMFNEIPGRLEWEKAVGGADGFKDLESRNYKSPSEDSATYTLGRKKVNHNGQARDLIIVVIRGTNKDEWKGNMNVTGTGYVNLSMFLANHNKITQVTHTRADGAHCQGAEGQRVVSDIDLCVSVSAAAA